MTVIPNILAAAVVAPLFAVAGGLAVSIPIIIHILNRRRFKIVVWAAMDFLLNAMKKNRRRLKFEQWVLLAIRCLAVFLFGLALARLMDLSYRDLFWVSLIVANLLIVFALIWIIDAQTSIRTHIARAVGGPLALAGYAIVSRGLGAITRSSMLVAAALISALLGYLFFKGGDKLDESLAGAFGERTGMHVFVIDNSYSMSYDAGRPGAATHLMQAKLLAKQSIDRLSSGGESVVIITAGRPAVAVGNGKATYDLEAAKAAIDRIEQSAGGTDLNGALQLAMQVGRDESRQAQKYLYLMTDGTKSAWEGPASASLKQMGLDLAAKYKVRHFNLGQAEQTNVASTNLSAGSNLVTTKFSADFRTTVLGFGPQLEAPLQWKIDGEQKSGGGVIKLGMDPEKGSHSLSNIIFPTGGAHVVTATITGGDRLAIDDTRYLVTNVASETRVLVVEGERGINGEGGSASDLEKALSPPSDDGGNTGLKRTKSWAVCETISPLELSGKVLADYSAVVMVDVGQITAGQADRLAAYAQSGGTVVWTMGEQVNSENYNQLLVPRKLLPGVLAKRVSVGAGERGRGFDFNPKDPGAVLADFGGVENSGLDRAEVWTYWQLVLNRDSGTTRILNYLPAGTQATTRGAFKEEDMDPAITMHNLGNGRVVFFSTTAGRKWTGLPRKPAFLPLMQQLISGTVISGDSWLNRQVGQTLEIPANVQFTGQPQLLDPTKKVMVLEPAPVGASISFKSEPLLRPGIYTIAAAGKSIPVAVNVPGDEADVRTLDNKAIKVALGGIDIDLQADQLPAVTVSTQAGSDFGWTVMLIVLCIAALECFLAMHFGHTRRAVVKA